MIHTPTMKELQSFLVTAQQLNFTTAAQVLNLTQGAVSRQISSLETRLNIRLFNRHARGLTLTHKGTEFLPLVENALNQIHRAVDQITNDKQQIKLKVPSCITSWLLPKLMTFQQQYPEIDVELTSAIKHNINFASEPFDAAICYGQPPRQKDLISYLLFEEQLAPVCSPRLLATHEHTLAADEMRAFTWLHATPQKSDWSLWLSHIAQKSAIPEKMAPDMKQSEQNQHFATLDLAVSAAMQGFGIAIGDITLARPDLDAGRLVMPNPNSVASGNGYYLVRPKNLQTASLDLLFDWLQQPESRESGPQV
ncbi:LysR substrate-binding domain-containing protein [Photobacterium sp. TY1-4]|uniref:LysR substrate-binding domain-containing protein n=1 Tax=Photobacterium sp. TY1-4 TaxID=2899122 RepID=UPI0021BE6144|nr:LysR substrate-binding domain-containing protein [Photobacterium sp. TY1-4]UXI04147.1 LysR substrate-binding domain-containing protein [Photobacterium sp. TY1-4]